MSRRAATARLPHALLVVVAISFSPAARAATYDAAADFSIAGNPTPSGWSYGYVTGTNRRDGDYTLLPVTGPSNIPWSQGGHAVATTFWEVNTDGPPVVGANQTAISYRTGTKPDIALWRPGTLFMHPPASGYTVVAFVAPASGPATITFLFTRLPFWCGVGIDWYVDINNGLNGDLARGRLGANGTKATHTGLRTLSVTLNQGDQVQFLVGPYQEYNCDWTTLKATISQ
jgi:hypothetical protein